MSFDGFQISSDGSVQGTKPLRLRAACNTCHNAKIRCSGERDGCTRCRNLNQVYACKYSVSRVGRASTRNNACKTPDQVDPVDQIPDSGSTGGSRGPTRQECKTLDDTFEIQDIFNDPSINCATLGTQSPYFSMPEFGQVEPDFSSWQQLSPQKNCNFVSPASLENGTDMAYLSFDTHNNTPNISIESSGSTLSPQEALRPSSPRAQHIQQQQQQQQRRQDSHSQLHSSRSVRSSSCSEQSSGSKKRSISSTNDDDSSSSRLHSISSSSNTNQCITLCTRIISQLDTQSSDSSLGLDSVLRISKCCINSLFQITNLESCKENPNCLLLLCVAVNQMITLFENNVKAIDSPLTSPSFSPLPSLLFGSYMVDQEDQLAFCTRLICRQIQRCRQLLDCMSGMYQFHQQQEHPLQPNSIGHSTASLLDKQWFLASIKRLDSLVAAVMT